MANGDQVFICIWCGKAWEGRRKKYCSRACQLAEHEALKARQRRSPARIYPLNICTECGKEWRGRKQRYCGVECKRKAGNARQKQRSRDKGARPVEQWREEQRQKAIERDSCTCEQCGTIFEYRAGGNTTEGSGRFCSNKCKGEWRSLSAGPWLLDGQLVYGKENRQNGVRIGSICNIHFKTCKQCDKLFVGHKYKRSDYCSEVCRVTYLTQYSIEYEKKKKEQKNPYVCKWCEEVFIAPYGSKRRIFCSDICIKQYRNFYKKKRKGFYGNHRQRARHYGVEYQRIKDIDILKRDKWTCCYCGCKMSKELRGTYKPNSPEIDHIIPMSKGGPHIESNLVCSCRECNNLKSDTTAEGQMFLALLPPPTIAAG